MNNIGMHILKFVALLVGMGLISNYIPYGNIVSAIIVFVGLWEITK